MPINYGTNDVSSSGNINSSGIITATSGVFANLSVQNDISVPNVVYTTGNQSISGIKTFERIDVTRNIMGSIILSDDLFGGELGIIDNLDQVIAISYPSNSSFKYGSSSPGSQDGIIIDSNKNVGIGTESPSGQLHVIGSGIFTSGLFINNTGVSISGHSHTTSDITDFNSSVSGLVSGIYQPLLNNPVTGTGIVNHIAYWNSSSGIVADSGQLVWDSSNNRLGVGTSSPTSQLHVIGTGVFSNTGATSVITIDPDGRSIDVNPSNYFNDIILKANGQNIFRGLDNWTGTWNDAVSTTYFQVGRSAGNTIFTSFLGNAFNRLAYSANKILFTNNTSNLLTPSGYFTINSNINGGSAGTSGLVIDTTHSSASANGQSHGALVLTPLFNTVGSNLNNIYGAYIAPRHSGVYTTTNSYALYVNATNNITGTVTNNYAAVFDGGNVGIRTATPSGQLHVVGSGIFSSGLHIISEDIKFTNVNSRLSWDNGSEYIARAPGTDGIVIATQAVTKVIVTSAGNVGINTTNPSQSLEVSGNIAQTWTGNDQRLAMVFNNDWRMGINYGAAARTLNLFSTSNDTNGHIIFSTRIGSGTSSTDYGTERMRITGSGRVGIGTSTPSGQLHIIGTGLFSQRVGIGTNSPSYILDVTGTGNFTQNLLVNGTGVSLSGHKHVSYIEIQEALLEDPQSALADIGAAPLSHTHISADITNFSSGVNSLVSGTYAPLTGATFTGAISGTSGIFTSGINIANQTASTITAFDANKNVVSLSTATYPSLTELSYVKGVTSAIQTQINSKQNTLTNPITGTGIADYSVKWTSSSGVGTGLLIDTGLRIGIAHNSPSGGVHIKNNAGQWSSFNYGPSLLIDGARNNGIGFLDNLSSNPMAIVNNGGRLIFASMPPLGSSGTGIPPSPHFTITNTGTVVVGSTALAEASGKFGVINGSSFVYACDSIYETLSIGPRKANDGFSTVVIYPTGNKATAGLKYWNNTYGHANNTIGYNDGTTTNTLLTTTVEGNFGIGVSPSYKLHVNGTGNFTTVLQNGNRVKDLTLAYFTPLNNQPPASAFATLDTRNSIPILDFDDTTSESGVFVGILPENAALSSGLLVRIHWMATTATSGTCRWGVQFEKMTTDLDIDSFDITIAESGSVTNATNGIPTITEIPCTGLDSLAGGDLFTILIYRDSNDTVNDTMVGDAELIAIELRSII